MAFCLVVIALRVPWPVEFANFVLLGFGFYMLHAVIQIYASELAPAARGSAMALHSFFFFSARRSGRSSTASASRTARHHAGVADRCRGYGGDRLDLRALAAAAGAGASRKI